MRALVTSVAQVLRQESIGCIAILQDRQLTFLFDLENRYTMTAIQIARDGMSFTAREIDPGWCGLQKRTPRSLSFSIAGEGGKIVRAFSYETFARRWKEMSLARHLGNVGGEVEWEYSMKKKGKDTMRIGSTITV